MHDGIHIFTSGQAFSTAHQVIHIGHTGDEGSNIILSLHIVGLLQHIAGYLSHYVRQIVGALNQGTDWLRDLHRVSFHWVIGKGRLQGL